MSISNSLSTMWGMDSRQLTPQQIQPIRQVIARQLRYLERLRQRMDRRQFPPADPLYQLVITAINAAHHLHVRLHYLACDPGSVACE